jgi:Flp pilus assembly pilin Flp
MTRMRHCWNDNLDRIGCDGQTLVEYALIILVVVLVVMATVAIVGNTLLETYYNAIISAFPTL